ncbi:MAG: response regulator [Pelovirga sp.]
MTLQILIVDDDPQIAEIHRHFTEKVDGFCACGIAGNLEDAEKMSTLLKPDLILLDLYFPEGKGTEILWNLRARHQATDVILITAAKELEPLQEAIHGGVFDYILKPVMFQRFKEALERFRDYRLRMTAEATLDQYTVDRLLHPYKTATAGEPIHPKGIDALTLKKIQAVFVQSHPQGLSAEEVAAIIGAGRTTARRYLEYLVAHNELITELVYGTVGRPERRYFKQKTHPSS